MENKVYYISYDDKDNQLRSRSLSILNSFFGNGNFKIDEEFSGILFVASGGSEQYAAKLKSIKKSIILLCHRESNSFAATIEIASYFRARNKNVSIINIMSPNAYNEFVEVNKVFHAIEDLSKQKAGIIGEVSSWLINSDIENNIIKEKLGAELLRIPWSQVDDYKNADISDKLMGFFPDFDKKKLIETSKVYSVLDKVIKQHNLSAISVECFSMVNRDKVTACLPLAVFNTVDIVASCEGDVCSMIGSLIIRSLTNMIPWQANVAEIRENTVLLAHCTAPLTNLKSFNITTHFETNCGTAIEGKFNKGKVGVFRVNSKLDSYMLLEGEIIETPNHSFACRTQVEFKTTKEQALLLKNKGLGNHHLIFPLELTSIVKLMMKQLRIERVD